MADYRPEETYTLEDLDEWNFPGTSLAVLGYPVRHSLSPPMHNAALTEMAKAESRFEDWRYFKFEILPEQLAAALPRFFEKRFMGLNLTVPHKTLAFDLIDDIDPAARMLGAVNTLQRLDNGYAGYNTDGYGLEQGTQRGLGRSLRGSPIVLLGAGGAARAAAAQCLRSGCASLAIVNRNPQRLASLVEIMEPFAQKRGIELKGFDPGQAGEAFAEGCLVINATSLGLKSDDPLPIEESLLAARFDLYDMIYNPPETALMKAARDSGCQAANGLDMLVYQGEKALQIWSDSNPSAQTMRRAARKAM